MALQQPPQYVPEDILIDIFLRLQIKSIGVCRCVCKTWHYTIGTTCFLKRHLILQKTASKRNNCILYRTDRLCTVLTGSQSMFDGTLNHSKFYNVSWILSRYNDTSYTGGPRIYGTCNGLLCLSAYHYSIRNHIYLWNPTCRKIKKLPKLDKCVKDEIGFTWKACVTFGYYDDDCKVIVIAPVGTAYFVCVYSLTTNSWKYIRTNSWNVIRAKVYYNNTYVDGLDKYCRVKETKFVHGTVYMIELDHVTCFDLRTKIIRVIHFPEEFRRYVGYNHVTERSGKRMIMSLPGEFSENNGFTCEAYGETIAIFGYGDMSSSLTMWILTDKSSFTPVWSVNKDTYYFSYYRPLGFLKNNQYLISLTEMSRSKLFSCKLSNPKLRESQLVGRFSNIEKGRIHSRFVESLLLLDEDNLDTIDFFTINGERVFLNPDD